MLKPIIFEVAVMLVAATSYLYHREFAGAPDPADAVRAAVVDASRVAHPEAVKTAVPDLQPVQAWVVPSSAVLHLDGRDYIFADRGAGRFQRIPVQGYALGGGRYAITGGLDSRQPVVIAGADALNQLAGRSP